MQTTYEQEAVGMGKPKTKTKEEGRWKKRRRREEGRRKKNEIRLTQDHIQLVHTTYFTYTTHTQYKHITYTIVLVELLYYGHPWESTMCGP